MKRCAAASLSVVAAAWPMTVPFIASAFYCGSSGGGRRGYATLTRSIQPQRMFWGGHPLSSFARTTTAVQLLRNASSSVEVMTPTPPTPRPLTQQRLPPPPPPPTTTTPPLTTVTTTTTNPTCAVTVDIYPWETADVKALSQQYEHVKTIYYLRHAEGTHNVDRQYHDPIHLDARLTERGKEQCRMLADRIRRATTTTQRRNVPPSPTVENDDDDDDNKDEEEDPLDPILVQLRESVQLVVTSPLTRCIQTALLSLEPVLSLRNRGGHHVGSSTSTTTIDDVLAVSSSVSSSAAPAVKIVAHEGIRETVNYNCDRRRTVEELQQEFGTPLSPPTTTQQQQQQQQHVGVVDFSFIADNHDSTWDYYETWLGSDVEYPQARESAQIFQVAQRARIFFTNFLASRSEHYICLCTHRAFSRVLWNFGLSNYQNSIPQSLDLRRAPQPQPTTTITTTTTSSTTDHDGSNDNDNTNNNMYYKEDIPVVRYMGDEDFVAHHRANYKNCELRAMVIAFGQPQQQPIEATTPI